MKLFRKFRMQQIKSQQIIRYLLYALGEIILVVIGILIALQINDWNQTRLDRKKEVNYLEEIRNNLVSDSMEISEVIAFNEKKIKFFQDSIPQLFSKNSRPEKLIKVLARNFQKIIQYNIPRINSTAFENMKSVDNLAIIENEELRKRIVSYYNLSTESLEERIKQKTRNLTDYVSPKLVTYESIKDALKLDSNFPKNDQLDYKKDQQLFVYLFETIPLSEGVIETCNYLLSEIEKLLVQINQEINYLEK